MGRTKNSVLNVSSSFIVLLCRTVMSFIVRTVFIKTLGADDLGLNGLFTNIISMLSLTELGVGVAINYSLYKPLAHKDYHKVSILLSFYKRIYRWIGIIMSSIGLLLIPFLQYIIGDVVVNGEIILIYLLYLFNATSMYFISYKETLIFADQQTYKLFNINFITWMAVYILQIISLFLFKSFIIYLLVQIILIFIQRVSFNKKITKTYPYIDFNNKEKLDKADLNAIIVNIKSMFFHKIGNYLVSGSDNIIISTFLGVSTVGIYTNYLSLTTMINSLINSLYRGVTASLGNLIVMENEKTQENVFNIVNFIAFVIYSYATICFLTLFNPFVKLWIGGKYLLDMPVVILICLNFYFVGMRLALDTVKEAAGMYKVDRYVPLLQALLNLVISIPLVLNVGLIGVIIGTVFSYLLLPFWHRPYIVYTKVFKSNPFVYYKDYVIKFVSMVIIYIAIYFIMSKISFSTGFASLLMRLLITTVIYIVLFVIMYGKNKNFKFCLKLVLKRK